MNRLYRYWWVPFILFLLLLDYATKADAGEITLNWQPNAQGPAPDGYRVYTGTAPGEYGFVDVGLVLQHSLTNLPNCQPGYYAIKAYKGGAESQFSTEVSTYPRPSISDVQSSGAGTHKILGQNFDINLKVFVDSGSGFVELPAADVERISCGEVNIPEIPLYRVQLSNVAQPVGHGEPLNIFTQPWPGPELTVE
jgi:hypothetical protein